MGNKMKNIQEGLIKNFIYLHFTFNFAEMNQYRKSPRARILDYDNGEYFVTICIKDKKHYFGEILNSKMMKSAIGFFVEDMMLRCTDMCPKISIPLYVIMPNHIHMIVSTD